MVARSERDCEEWWQGVEGIVKSGGKEGGILKSGGKEWKGL